MSDPLLMLAQCPRCQRVQRQKPGAKAHCTPCWEDGHPELLEPWFCTFGGCNRPAEYQVRGQGRCHEHVFYGPREVKARARAGREEGE